MQVTLRLAWILVSFGINLKDLATDLVYLKQASEDVKFKHGNVVVTGEIDRGLESHGLHAILEGVHVLQLLLESRPRHDAPVVAQL